jgi:hypothetical protein
MRIGKPADLAGIGFISDEQRNALLGMPSLGSRSQRSGQPETQVEVAIAGVIPAAVGGAEGLRIVAP